MATSGEKNVEPANLQIFEQLNNLDRSAATGKSQSEALLYWLSDSKVNTVGQDLRFSRDDRMFEVIKLFIMWLMN